MVPLYASERELVRVSREKEREEGEKGDGMGKRRREEGACRFPNLLVSRDNSPVVSPKSVSRVAERK